MRIDLHINQALAPFDDVIACAVRADAATYDAVWVLDHLASMEPSRNKGQMLDPHVLLGAIATRTSRVNLGVLVNNAASYAAFDLTEARDEQIVDVVTQSLIAPMFCSRQAVIEMRKVGGGDIVNISTQSVLTPQPTMIVYSAAKGGLDVFAQGLRNEFRTENIRVLTVQVGVVANSTLDTADPEGAAKYMAGLQRAGLEKAFVFPGSTPADIAGAIVHAVTAPRNTVIEDIVIRGFEGREI